MTPGGLVHLLHRAARDAGPTYTALREQVRNSPLVTPDETGWRVGAVRHWLWVFVAPKTTVYAIRAGRGFDDAASVLGTDYAGVLVRDGWAPYRRFEGALHQTCLAHLLRRSKQLLEDHPHSRWAAQVQAVLQTSLDVRDRCNDGELTEHGLASVRGRLVARLGRLIDAPPALADAERFAAHLATEFAAVFLFLSDPSVDATNWRAEQAIRPAVVIRKVCGGNRTRRGADTQQVLASVVRTARQRRPRPAAAARHDVAGRRPGRARRLRTPTAARLRADNTAHYEARGLVTPTRSLQPRPTQTVMPCAKWRDANSTDEAAKPRRRSDFHEPQPISARVC